MQLRPYQNDAIKAVETTLSTRHSTLICIATGGGKTIIFSNIAKNEVQRGGRVLILAHRGELLEQAIDKLYKATGIKAGLEKADSTTLDERWDEFPYTVVVGSVQTLSREKRLNQFRHDEFSLVIIDECHHAMSSTYRTVIDYFNTAKFLGVTATPDRGDMQSLAEVFETVSYEYSIVQAIRDGYLVPITVQTIPLKIDLTSVAKQAGDYQAAGVGTALDPYLEQICKEISVRCKERKTIVFTPLIATSLKMVEYFKQLGIVVREVNGSSEDRAETIKWFETAPKGSVLVNSMLLCLDMKTEILTQRGFLKHDEITEDDLVANWRTDGSVFFAKPDMIVKRPLETRERMVYCNSRTINFRVTNTHRMLVKNCGGWHKIPADELLAENGSSRNYTLPACGISKPSNVQVEQPKAKELTKEYLSKTAFNLRKSHGMTYEESYRESRRRAEHRNSLKFKQPNELTLDECRFIGFFIAEGTCAKLSRGGVEYSFSQSISYPHIIEWFDRVCDSINVDYLKKYKTRNAKERKLNYTDYYRWSFSRGTGNGCQSRRGLFHLEPYLKRHGTELFWGLDEKQFDALVEGYWYGDGFHGSAEFGMPKSISARDTSKDWINLLCAIGSVRGWRCAIHERPQKNPKHSMQYEIRMVKGGVLYFNSKTICAREEFANEDVWCVKTKSSNIVTRRNGYVTVMGNTEGFDEPSVDAIVVLRATRVRSLYCLDEATEVLTHNGWKNDVSIGEEVATFDTSTNGISFMPVIANVRRELDDDEFFCSFNGQSSDIRVTNKHRMLYDNKRRHGWKFATAEYVADMKDGAYIPVAGHGSFAGVPLTDAEIRFIGWVMTDGSINRKNGAIQISQSSIHVEACASIQNCIDDCNFKYGKHIMNSKSNFVRNGDNIVWTIFHGEPRGTHKDRTGWARLEPWISKDISNALFDMTEHQFDVMLEVVNLADGRKLRNVPYEQLTMNIGKGNKQFIENLQIMALMRGYRANVSVEDKPPRKNPLYRIYLRKQSFIKIGGGVDGRPQWKKESHIDETCWCVETEAGTLVTRRNGKVAIMGNCQMIGRGTRLSEGKKDLLVLDFLWLTQTHDLCRPAALVTDKAEAQKKITEKQLTKEELTIDAETLDEAVSETVIERENMLAERLRKQSHKRGQLIDPLAYAKKIGSVDLMNKIPTKLDEEDKPTIQQLEKLEQLGFSCPLSSTAADALIKDCEERKANDCATPKQVRMLEAKGFQNVSQWSSAQARKMIARMATNGWRIPFGVDATTYKP